MENVNEQKSKLEYVTLGLAFFVFILAGWSGYGEYRNLQKNKKIETLTTQGLNCIAELTEYELENQKSIESPDKSWSYLPSTQQWTKLNPNKSEVTQECTKIVTKFMADSDYRPNDIDEIKKIRDYFFDLCMKGRGIVD